MAHVPSQRIDVQIFPAFTNRLSKAWLRKVAGQALDNQGEGKALNVSIVIADDETVHSLNREYRNLDETTDVLAFPLWESRENQESGTDGFVLPAEETIPTGEIVISYHQAARQAREGKKLLRSEIALLIVHGVLHLLGYDHADVQQESQMWARQDEILARVPFR